MPRKSELDKPFAVDGSRHLLKDFDAAGVVFDEVVVVAEDGGDFVLCREIMDSQFKTIKMVSIQRWNGCPRIITLQTLEFGGNSRHILEYFL